MTKAKTTSKTAKPSKTVATLLRRTAKGLGTSKRPLPSRRLPIFDSLRSNDELRATTVATRFGPLSQPIHDAIMKLETHSKWLNDQLLQELCIAASFIEDLQYQRNAAPALPSFTKEEAKRVSDATLSPLDSKGWGLDTFPEWILNYALSEDIEPLRNLTQVQADAQLTTVIARITEVQPNGRIVWSFFSNPSKTGYGFVPKEKLSAFTKGTCWMLKHNGKKGIDSAITGALQLTPEEAERFGYTLAQTWRRYH